MKRRVARQHSGRGSQGDIATDGMEGDGDDDVLDVVALSEDWAETEEDRVARWLQARTGVDAGARRSHPVRSDPFGASSGRSGVELDVYRRDLVAAVQVAEGRIEASRTDADRDRAAMEAELRTLEEHRQRLTAGLEAQQAEYRHVVAKHAEFRRSLEEQIADLEMRAASLAAELAAAEVEAGVVRAQRLQDLAEVEQRVNALREERTRMAAAVKEEYAEAEAAHQEVVAEAARLQGEVGALQAYRDQLLAAVQAGRADAERAHQLQEAEAERLRAEISALEAEAEAARQVDLAPGGGSGATAVVVGPQSSGGPLDPSGQLASAVAELGRHLASVLEAERARAQRLEREQQEARARFDAERRLLESQYGGGSENASDHQPTRGLHRRRRPTR